MTMTLNQMYRVTPANIRANSMSAQVQVRSRGKHKKYARLGDVYEIIYKVKCVDEWRNVTLRFQRKKKTDKNLPTPSLSTPVWVRCTCPWFLYHCEYALTQHGSSWVHYSNGAPANQTNPRNIPFVCKHVYALQRTVKNFDLAQPKVIAPQNKVLPKDTLTNLLKNKRTPSDKLLPQPTDPTLTRHEQRTKDEALDTVYQAIEQVQQHPTPVSTDVVKTLDEIVESIEQSPVPISEPVRREIHEVVDTIEEDPNQLHERGLLNKLKNLVKKFRNTFMR